MMQICALLGLAAPSEGHFGMIQPPTWLSRSTQEYGNNWRSIGCGDVPRVSQDPEKKLEGCIMQWYTNATHVPQGQAITIPHELRTFQGWWPITQRNPWAAPGTAPLFSPCGVDGGNAQGCPVGNPGQGGCAVGGYGHGPDARDWYQHRSRPQTIWPAGSAQKIAWGVEANHGGGYSVRLCKMPKSGMLADLTEDCFQANALDFVGDTSTAVYDGKERTQFQAQQVKLSTGMWRRNPIPACKHDYGGSDTGSCTSASDTQFPPPVPGMYGFAGSVYSLVSSAPLKKWEINDHVWVPKLPAGDYVLSIRFDSEQTPQVWSNCADIKITSLGNSSEQTLV